jgi:hypothetical protein
MTETNELAAALAKAQAEFKQPVRNKVGKVSGISKKTNKYYEYEYKYADLAAVQAAVLPALNKHGIAVVQAVRLSDAGWAMETILLHTSGQRMESWLPLPSGVSAQEMGSWISYWRRYELSAICCISSEDDDDGKAAEDSGVDLELPTVGPPSAPSAHDTARKIIENPELKAIVKEWGVNPPIKNKQQGIERVTGLIETMLNNPDEPPPDSEDELIALVLGTMKLAIDSRNANA